MEYVIGSQLKKLRNAAGKTQKEVAEQLFITESTYRNYENDRVKPDLETVMKLIQLFSTTADYLLLGIEPPPKVRKDVYELKIYKEEDRVTVAGILNKNGYATCFNKRKRVESGKAIDYYVLVKATENGDGLCEIDGGV